MAPTLLYGHRDRRSREFRVYRDSGRFVVTIDDAGRRGVVELPVTFPVLIFERYRSRLKRERVTKRLSTEERLSRWAELGKTYEAVAQCADEWGLTFRGTQAWLKNNGETVPRVYKARGEA